VNEHDVRKIFPRASVDVIAENCPFVCIQCGTRFNAPPSRERKFCSLRCAYDNPNRVGGIAETQRKKRGFAACQKCGRVFEKHTHSGKGFFCSQICSVSRSRGMAGWRVIGRQRIYARSRWEANYARFLEFLRKRKEIRGWQHEAETFWFETIRRGARSYLPDFKVIKVDGSVEFHEVKGWMDSRSRTKLKRMAKYHPAVTMVVRDKVWFRDNSAFLKKLIKGWE